MLSDLGAVGPPDGGLVCDPRKRKASAVLLTDAGRDVDRHRRDVSAVGQPGGIRLSSSLTDIIGSLEARKFKKRRVDSGRSKLVVPDVVSRIAGSAGGSSKGNSSNAEVIETGPRVPRQPGVSKPTRVEAITRSLCQAGFSEQAASRMSGSVRKSTSNVYQSKWSIFSDWCDQRKADPLRASIPVVADFLLFLRDVKKFSLPTIKGYRSAIALVLKPAGTDVTNSPELTALVRSFALEIPRNTSKLPKWDLSVVLASLLSPPYEPLKDADIKFITHKTVFLIALASAKRVSELQALSSVVLHTENWSSVSFDFADDFVAKTEIPALVKHQLRIFNVPALSQLSGDREDLLLCPVRALRVYLEATRDRRKGGNRLFLPVLGDKLMVSKNTISAWLSTTIKRAYESDRSDQHRLFKVSAHEVRALATSWQFSHNLSLDSVMSAASWRTHSTFSNFYLRDVSLVADDLHALGPIVAAQAIVTPRASQGSGTMNPSVN